MLLIAGIILLTIINFIFHAFDYDVSFKNQIHRVNLPDSYKNYQPLETTENIKFGNQEMQLLFESEQELIHFISSNNEVIIKEGGSIHTLHKINRVGELVDKTILFRDFSTKSQEFVCGDYIINSYGAYYKNWILDGDSSEIPMIVHNKDNTWTHNEKYKLLNFVLKHCPYYDYQNDLENTSTIAYFHEDKWQLLYVYIKDSYKYVLRKGTLEYDTSLFSNAPNNIKPIYYQREEYVKSRSSNGNNASYSWVGRLYATLLVDEDVLNFSMALSVPDLGTGSGLYKIHKQDIRNTKESVYEQIKPFVYCADARLEFKMFSYNSNAGNQYGFTNIGQKIYKIKMITDDIISE